MLQAIIAQARLGIEEGATFAQPNMQVEVARLQEFNGSSGRVAGFITACKLYIHMRIKGVIVEEQIQWVLSRSLTVDLILFFAFHFILSFFFFFCLFSIFRITQVRIN